MARFLVLNFNNALFKYCCCPVRKKKLKKTQPQRLTRPDQYLKKINIHATNKKQKIVTQLIVNQYCYHSSSNVYIKKNILEIKRINVELIFYLSVHCKKCKCCLKFWKWQSASSMGRPMWIEPTTYDLQDKVADHFNKAPWKRCSIDSPSPHTLVQGVL